MYLRTKQTKLMEFLPDTKIVENYIENFGSPLPSHTTLWNHKSKEEIVVDFSDYKYAEDLRNYLNDLLSYGFTFEPLHPLNLTNSYLHSYNFVQPSHKETHEVLQLTAICARHVYEDSDVVSLDGVEYTSIEKLKRYEQGHPSLVRCVLYRSGGQYVFAIRGTDKVQNMMYDVLVITSIFKHITSLLSRNISDSSVVDQLVFNKFIGMASRIVTRLKRFYPRSSSTLDIISASLELIRQGAGEWLPTQFSALLDLIRDFLILCLNPHDVAGEYESGQNKRPIDTPMSAQIIATSVDFVEKSYLDALKSIYPSTNLVITGHSLGGFLAQCLAVRLHVIRREYPPVTTFNALGCKPSLGNINVERISLEEARINLPHIFYDFAILFRKFIPSVAGTMVDVFMRGTQMRRASDASSFLLNIENAAEQNVANFVVQQDVVHQLGIVDEAEENHVGRLVYFEGKDFNTMFNPQRNPLKEINYYHGMTLICEYLTINTFRGLSEPNRNEPVNINAHTQSLRDLHRTQRQYIEEYDNHVLGGSGQLESDLEAGLNTSGYNDYSDPVPTPRPFR